MAVHIRLQRFGKKGNPFYYIVATDHRKKRDGECLEKIGYYDPKHEPSQFVVKEDRLQYWYGVGGVPSNTVQKLVIKNKIKLERSKTHTKKA